MWQNYKFFDVLTATKNPKYFLDQLYLKMFFWLDASLCKQSFKWVNGLVSYYDLFMLVIKFLMGFEPKSLELNETLTKRPPPPCILLKISFLALNVAVCTSNMTMWVWIPLKIIKLTKPNLKTKGRSYLLEKPSHLVLFLHYIQRIGQWGREFSYYRILVKDFLTVAV